MKKILVLTVACTALAGCSYLGQPEAYTVISEEKAPVVEQVRVEAPAPVVAPCGGVYCAQAPRPAPIVAPVVSPCTTCAPKPMPCTTCAPVPVPVKAYTCPQGGCQTNYGIKDPLVIHLPGHPIYVQ